MSDMRWFAFSNLFHVTDPLEGTWEPDEYSDDPEAGMYWDASGNYDCPAEDGLVWLQDTVCVFSSSNIDEVWAFVEGNNSLRAALRSLMGQAEGEAQNE